MHQCPGALFRCYSIQFEGVRPVCLSYHLCFLSVCQSWCWIINTDCSVCTYMHIPPLVTTGCLSVLAFFCTCTKKQRFLMYTQRDRWLLLGVWRIYVNVGPSLETSFANWMITVSKSMIQYSDSGGWGVPLNQRHSRKLFSAVDGACALYSPVAPGFLSLGDLAVVPLPQAWVEDE